MLKLNDLGGIYETTNFFFLLSSVGCEKLRSKKAPTTEGSVIIKEQFIDECSKTFDKFKSCTAQIDTQENRPRSLVEYEAINCMEVANEHNFRIIQKFSLKPKPTTAKFELLETSIDDCSYRPIKKEMLACLNDIMTVFNKGHCKELARQL